MGEAKISVIVPTHDGADRIGTALESVRKQTFKDYELIVVCDRCADGTEKIAEEHGATVICGDFGSDGRARNAGLDAARGEWVLFLDDDDWFLHLSCFDLLQRMAGRHGEDVLNFSFLVKGHEYIRQTPEKSYSMVWCRAWRREFIGGSRFKDMPYGSDTEFYNRVVHQNPDVRLAFWDMPIYCYNYLREGSLTWQKYKGGGNKDE